MVMVILGKTKIDDTYFYFKRRTLLLPFLTFLTFFYIREGISSLLYGLNFNKS